MSLGDVPGYESLVSALMLTLTLFGAASCGLDEPRPGISTTDTHEGDSASDTGLKHSTCECSALSLGAIEGKKCPPEFTEISTDSTAMCVPDFPIWGIGPVEPESMQIDSNGGVVQHQLTGLIWQLDAGLAGKLDHKSALSHCRKLTTGGFDDWRMPTAAELLSIVDFGGGPHGTWPGAKSPFMPKGDSLQYGDFTWSATPHVGETGQVWVVQRETVVKPQPSIDEGFVRCVRGGKSSREFSSRFKVLANCLVQDQVTGLSWKSCVSASEVEYGDASASCAALPTPDGSGSKWRLPTVREAMSLISRSRSKPSIVDGGFGFAAADVGEAGNILWTTTPEFAGDRRGQGMHFVVSLDSGHVGVDCVSSFNGCPNKHRYICVTD